MRVGTCCLALLLWVVVTMLSDEYTPTTEEIRSAAGDMLCPDEDAPHDEGCGGDAMFDRWLAVHDREVRIDQIEKDAAIAQDRHRKVQDEPALIAWRIGQQLNGIDPRRGALGVPEEAEHD